MLLRTSFGPRSFTFRPGAVNEFDLLQRQLDALFNQPAERAALRPDVLGLEPRISETPEAFVATMVVPGLKASELEINASGDVLTIKGERKTQAPEGYRLRRQERSPLRFVRRLSLNGRVLTDGIDAKLSDGILTITLPKRPQDQARAIEIKG